MTASGPGSSRPRSTGRKVLFSAITGVAFFALLEGGLALLGVRARTVTEDPYVGFSTYFPLFEPAPGDEGLLRTAPSKLSLFNDQSFRRRKPPGVRRIFTLGGSTTYGRPFEDTTSFSGWLRTHLDLLAGDGRWEVINAGGISYASYRVATLMEELVSYEPDLFIVYSGNNEFLEKRTYAGLIAEPRPLRRTRLVLQKSRLYSLGRRVADAPRRRAQERYEMSGEVEELLESSAGLDRYQRDEGFERQVLEHYRFNLQRMVDLARSAGAGVVLVTIPVNEKDFSPFKSEHRHDLDAASRRAFGDHLAVAVERLERGAAEEAVRAASSAVRIDPLHAEAHFVLGRSLLAQRRFEEAGASFAEAIEEDVCPLRALEGIHSAIEETALRNHLPLVDYRASLRRRMAREHGHTLLGDELFFDHVHPTIEAHGLLAERLVETMAEMGLVRLDGESWRKVRVEARRRVLAGVEEAEYARAYKNLSKVLLWAGKRREAEKYLRLAEQRGLSGDWELSYSAGVLALEAGRIDDGVRRLREAAELRPDAARVWDQLGSAYANRGELEEALAAGERAVALEPERAPYWDNLAATARLAGDAERAVELGRRAVELDPELAAAYNNLGNAYFDLGELDAAQRAYERAVELRPGFAEALANRGLVLGERGEMRSALESLNAALAIDDQLAPAHLGRGRALLALGDAAAAVPSLERALEAGADDEGALAVLAHALLAQGRSEEAGEIVRRGLERWPAAARLHHLRGRLLAQERRYGAAGAAFERATTLEPEAEQAWMDLAMLRLVEERFSQAVTTCERALVHHPASAGLHHVCGKAVALAGRGLAEARAHLERARELAPDNALVANDLGSLLEQQGELEQALVLYRQAAAVDPRFEQALENARRVTRRLEQ